MRNIALLALISAALFSCSPIENLPNIDSGRCDLSTIETDVTYSFQEETADEVLVRTNIVFLANGNARIAGPAGIDTPFAFQGEWLTIEHGGGDIVFFQYIPTDNVWVGTIDGTTAVIGCM